MYIEDFNQMNRAFMINSSIIKLFNELDDKNKVIANKHFFELHNKTLKS